jgi:hypothetical protein
MTALAASTSLRQVAQNLVSFPVPIYAAAKIYEGAMVCLRTADGYAVRAGTSGTGRVIGIAQSEAATPTASGDESVYVLCGQFIRPVHATHTPTVLDVGKAVYASDDQTISNDPTDGPVAGLLLGFEDGSGDAIFFVEPPDASLASLAQKEILVYPAILAAGTPMAAFADNAASAPGITLVDSEGMGIRWNNAATQVAVWTRFTMPLDIDTSKPAILELFASKTGATVGDATTFTITAFNNAKDATHDGDADFGGATSAMTGNATAKTVQRVTRTLAAADLGQPGEPVSLSFKPTDGTLGTDDVVLFGMNLRYTRKS